VNKKHAIHENFEIRKMFKDMFQSDDSPIYQLKKHYPEIYGKVMLGSLMVQLFLEKILNKESLKSSTVKTSILKVTLHFTSTLFSALKKVPALKRNHKN
jgi:hypothetical protein